MIEIGKTHTIQHDSRQWILIHHPTGRRISKTGSVRGERTYYGRIERAFDRIIDDRIKGAESIQAMAKRVVSARRDVVTAAETINAALYPPEYPIVASPALEAFASEGELT